MWVDRNVSLLIYEVSIWSTKEAEHENLVVLFIVIQKERKKGELEVPRNTMAVYCPPLSLSLTHPHPHPLAISLTPIHSLYLSLPQTHSFCSFKRLFLISYFTLDRFSQTHALSCNPPLYLFFYCSLQSGNEQRSMFDHRRPIL